MLDDNRYELWHHTDDINYIQWAFEEGNLLWSEKEAYRQLKQEIPLY